MIILLILLCYCIRIILMYVDEGTLPTLPPAIPVELSDDLAEESLSQPTSSSNTIVSVSQPSNSGNEVVCSTIVRQETDVSVATTGRN